MVRGGVVKKPKRNRFQFNCSVVNDRRLKESRFIYGQVKPRVTVTYGGRVKLGNDTHWDGMNGGGPGGGGTFREGQ